MALERDEATKLAAGSSLTAAVAAIIAALEAGRKPVAGEIPQELLAAIAAILAACDSINTTTQQILAAMGPGGRGWPANVKGIRTVTVTCLAANVAYQPDSLTVLDGMSLVIKSHPLNPVGSIVRVGRTSFEATSADASYPLLPNEAIAYQITDARNIFVSSTIAGAIVVFSTEQDV